MKCQKCSELFVNEFFCYLSSTNGVFSGVCQDCLFESDVYKLPSNISRFSLRNAEIHLPLGNDELVSMSMKSFGGRVLQGIAQRSCLVSVSVAKPQILMKLSVNGGHDHFDPFAMEL